MSSNKSFSTETWQSYARAIFELAQENAELDKVESNVSDLLNIYNSNSELEVYFKNPTTPLKEQTNVLIKISEMMKFSQTFKNFLSILVVKRRIFFLKKILTSFLKLSDLKKDKINAQLISSKKLLPEELENISNDLSKTIGKKISFNSSVDEELIGGFKMQIGSLMIDTSIKNRLKKYEKIMLEN